MGGFIGILSSSDPLITNRKVDFFDRRRDLRMERCRFLSVIILAGGGIVPFLYSIQMRFQEI